MNHESRFWDRHADKYSRKPIADEAAYQTKLETTREYLRPDSQVLEFGCGTGSTAILHSPYVEHIHAIDISKNMLEIARSKAQTEGIGNISLEQSDIDGFDAAPGSFDVVLGLSILHLLDDRQVAIEKVHRMLKPGGMFVSSTACIGEMNALLKYVLPIGKFLRIFPLVRVFTGQELMDGLIQAGFKIERQWQPGKGKAVFIVARKADKARRIKPDA